MGYIGLKPTKLPESEDGLGIAQALFVYGRTLSVYLFVTRRLG